ncbi:MAG TPA: HAMP domain-containing sensor histidine kinase [Nocardioidaceae bacterium]|nr:HAMP domain-containing sensor histidine kinase [Nocardioidaceae bacterium]
MRRLVPSSLTGRLVATLVLVVVVTSALIALVTSLALRSELYGRLDGDVQQSLARSVGRYNDGHVTPPVAAGAGVVPDRDGDGGPGTPGGRVGLGDAPGTLSAQFGVADGAQGVVVTTSSRALDLSTAALDLLREVPADGRIHPVTLPGVGRFRVKAAADASNDADRLVAGLSTRATDEVVANLVLWEVLLAVAAVAVAALAGRYLVRRQLRPLRDVAATAHEVAALPLSSGAIGTTVRVPDALTDERTEVGAVGAALNTMLEHVEHALDDRHRSELQVRRFVADASHELRTPLSTIHGYAELTRRTSPADPGQLAAAMGKVEQEANRMSSLVADMLLLARLDAGRPLARDEVDLTKLVLETVSDARVVAPDHRWLLDLSEEPVVVTGDELRLHQVITNLLNNARRHTPAGTSVRVGVHAPGAGGDPRADSTALLTVEDDGPGMPPDLVDSAFERFTRGDSSRTRESGGAGLGLSLVQAITAAHGGRVAVSSRAGRTRFEVRLPTTGGTGRPGTTRPAALHG